MDRTINVRSIMLERIGILVFISFYLIIFNVNVPHGDALRIARQFESKELIWNPNHLIFDLFGYAWTYLLQVFNSGISILNGFEIISAISTLISLLIFHKILIALNVQKSIFRILILLGLFSSKNFISMAISQYYFMMQMPFLLSAILFSYHFYKNQLNNNPSTNKLLYMMGVMLAIATGIEINNVVLVILTGFMLIAFSVGSINIRITNAIKFWSAAAAIGFTMFFAGYLFSGNENGFFNWVLAYQGESESSLDQFYGIQWSLSGVITAFAGTIFNLFFGNIIETAGLGTILKVLVMQLPLEFSPEYTKIILAALLMPIIGFGSLFLYVWATINMRSYFMLAFFITWIASYLIFNFFWTFGVDLFWFQILPVIWLLVVLNFGLCISTNGISPVQLNNFGKYHWKKYLLSITVLSLFVLNTLQTVMPVSNDKFDDFKSKHSAMLNEGDLEIIPGWDNYKWMMKKSSDTNISKLLLMNMALKSENDEGHIKFIPLYIKRHLEMGKRVIVGRLYGLDRESNPWYGLSDLGWSRAKIKTLLSDFCHSEVAKIDDVVFHEIKSCN